MRDLVRQHARNLRFVAGRVQHTTIDPHRTAGQGERVDLSVIGHRERIRILRARRGGRKSLPDSFDVPTDPRIAELRHLFPDLRVFLASDFDLLRNGDDGEGGWGR